MFDENRQKNLIKSYHLSVLFLKGKNKDIRTPYKYVLLLSLLSTLNKYLPKWLSELKN